MRTRTLSPRIAPKSSISRIMPAHRASCGEVLRNLLPDEQAKAFRDILALKDEAHYGAKPLLMTRAAGLFAKLEQFAAWAEDHLPHQPK